MAGKVKSWVIYKTLLALIFWIIVPFDFSFAQEPNVISKNEANWIFGMSLEEWKQHAIKARDAGVAGYETNGADEHSLIINTPPALMMITPKYSKDSFSSPWQVSLGLISHENFSDLWRNSSDAELRKMAANIYSHMTPEFTVFTSFTISDEMVFQEIQIFKQGDDIIADDMAEQYNGCFKECIIRPKPNHRMEDGKQQYFFDEKISSSNARSRYQFSL